jgi:class 3 adenylate cyclase
VAICRRCNHENPDGANFCNACGAPLERQRQERRKPATLLFCDVSGSTALAERIDAEAVREVLFSYFREMRAAIESHGGTVEKFVGDAVHGVFGVPVAHEDDPLRAVRAAFEMAARLPALNEALEARYGAQLAVRIGINTGEVLAADATTRESFASGDAVNVAARLEQAAQPGEILLGEATYALLRDAVEAEPLAPLALKGKAEPVTAYRLVGLRAEELREPAGRLVGRRRELAVLTDALARVVATGKPGRVLLLGEAGVGKSRLVEAFLTHAGDDVLALSARCLPYGEGITYSPLVQILRQAAAIGETADRRQALARLQRSVGTGVDGELVVGVLGQVLGLVDGVASAEEIAWAARRAAEALAAERPLVLLVDDLQWGEDPLVELVADIAARGQAPILIVCLARPELLERQPLWMPDIQLEPLAADDAEELLGDRLGATRLDAAARERLLAAAGGNPLFLEELVAYLEADGDPEQIPPTLDALLSAHLDTLAGDERGTLERASVEGEVFHQGATLALSDPPERAGVADALASLSTKELVREARSSFDDERAYRFRHLLVRDVAYRSAPKRRRADLHLRFSGWLETKLGDRILEVAEIVAYHLEQAWRLRSDLGPLDDETVEVGDRASEILAEAARRSLARGDAGSALNLFTRASELSASRPARVELELERGIAAHEAGDFALASQILREVEREAVPLDAVGVAARARVDLALIRHQTEPGAVDELRRAAGEALIVFEELRDDRGRAVALAALAEERWVALRCAEMESLLERALVHAEAARDERLTATVLISLARAILFGPDPASAASARCEELLARARRIGPTVEAAISMMLAVLEAAQGRAERSHELSLRSTSVLRELAPGPRVAAAQQYAGLAALILEDPERAERELRASYELLDGLGEKAVASTVTALLARALVELGRAAEAEPLCALSLEWADEGDLATQAYARSAWACALVARGDVEEAKRHALRAVELSAVSDFTNQRGDAFFDLALVLQAAGDVAGAHEAATSARALFEAKENRLSAVRAGALAASLAPDATPLG